MRFLSLFALLWAASLAAQEAITVGVANFPPNVVVDRTGPEPAFDGFDIELWKAVATRAELDYTVRDYPFRELLDALRNAEVDAALAGITISSARIGELDFSHPYMRSGLHILTMPRQESSFVGLFRAAAQSAAVHALLYLLGFVALAANVLYLAERGKGAIDASYLKGVAESAWCILATMTTVGYGDIAPRTWVGRLIAALVMLTGIGLFGLIIADLSAGLTMQQLSTDIESAADLRGKSVATVSESTSVETLASLGAAVREVEDIDDAYRLLENRSVAAVVFDAPPLMRYVAENPQSGALIVGPLLDPQQYGIGLPSGSELRTPINEALLALEENGEIERLYEKWFGAKPE